MSWEPGIASPLSFCRILSCKKLLRSFCRILSCKKLLKSFCRILPCKKLLKSFCRILSCKKLLKSFCRIWSCKKLLKSFCRILSWRSYSSLLRSVSEVDSLLINVLNRQWSFSLQMHMMFNQLLYWPSVCEYNTLYKNIITVLFRQVYLKGDLLLMYILNNIMSLKTCNAYLNIQIDIGIHNYIKKRIHMWRWIINLIICKCIETC